MVENTGTLRIYARTEAGEREVAERRRDLSQQARRILILIDGRRPLADLSMLARPGELEPIVAALEQAGLIRLDGLAPPPDAAQARERLFAEQSALAQAKAQLAGVFERELGASGQVWEARVADSVSVDVLRRVLREAVDVIFFRNGDDAARRIVGAVRPIFAQLQAFALGARRPPDAAG